MASIWILTEIEYIEYSNHPKTKVLARFANKPTFKEVKEKVTDWNCDPLIGAILRNDTETMARYIGNSLEYTLYECALD
jgi:hypothetical protein